MVQPWVRHFCLDGGLKEVGTHPEYCTSLTQAARSEAGDQQKHVTTAVAERFLATGSYDLFASNSPSRNELGPVLRSLDSHDATVVTSGAIWPGYPPQCTCNRHVYTLMSWHRLSLHKTRKSCRKSDLACWSQAGGRAGYQSKQDVISKISISFTTLLPFWLYGTYL